MHCYTTGLGSSPFARHYLGNHYLFSLPIGTKMFQFPTLALYICRVSSLQDDGLSHSEIRVSKIICIYTRLIAAYHVLHRLCEPRHPPCALSYFLAWLLYLTSVFLLLSCITAHTFSCILFFGFAFLQFVLCQYVKDLFYYILNRISQYKKPWGKNFSFVSYCHLFAFLSLFCFFLLSILRK